VLSVPRLCWLAEWDGPELPGAAEQDVPDKLFRVEHGEVCAAVAVIVARYGDYSGPAELAGPELPGAAEQDVPDGGLRVVKREIRSPIAVIVSRKGRFRTGSDRGLSRQEDGMSLTIDELSPKFMLSEGVSRAQLRSPAVPASVRPAKTSRRLHRPACWAVIGTSSLSPRDHAPRDIGASVGRLGGGGVKHRARDCPLRPRHGRLHSPQR
jgi:hypothetical protein